MFTNLSSLAFFCGVGAFYAHETDQENLFLGLVAAAFALMIFYFRGQLHSYEETERETMIYDRMEQMERTFFQEMKDLRSNIDK